MKKILFLVAFFAGFMSFTADAAITVTPGTGGTNICANRAVGGVNAGFTTLGNIVITEGLNNDITNGFHNLVLNAPAGWQFNTGAVPTFASTGSDVISVTSGGITTTSLTVQIISFGTANINSITITGLQVQATGAGSAAGAIRASAAPGMTGIVTGGAGTIFANLSLTPTVAPSVTIAAAPAGAICSGTNVTFTATPVNGGTPTFQWQINGVNVPGATNSTFSSTTLANGNLVRVIMTPTGCVSALTANSNVINMTVNTTPAAVSVTGAGTFCDNATINASLAGPGTIFYQGVVYNGTSIATPSTSQVITTPGTFTYYFRARSAAGNCWGPQGSARVTINTTPTGFAVSPATTATVCQGDSASFTASAVAPTTEVLHEDFDAGLGSWVITNVSGNANSFWQVRNAPGWGSAVAGGGSPYMQAAPDATGAGITTTTRVESPSFSLAGYTTANLSFNQYFQQFVADITVQVEYSIDGGGSWVPFINQLGVTTGVTSWVASTPTTTIAMPAATLNQPDVRLRWNYSSTFGWYWAIDNIRVSGTPTLTYNWAGLSGASGLSCTTCDMATITPAVSGLNSYTVSTTNAGCTAGTTVDITANPLPTVFNVTGGGAICAGGLGINIGLSGSEVGVDYQLFDAMGTVGTPVAGTGSALDFGLITTAGTYTVMATNSTTLCTNAMADSAVAYDAPAMSPITGPTEVCEAATVTLACADSAGTWTSSDATVATVDGTTGVVTGVLAGVVGITYTIPSGCFLIHDMTVNPSPVVAPIVGLTSLCEDATTTLTNATPGGAWSSDDATVASIDASGIVTGNGGGSATISYTVPGALGCSTTVTSPMNVTAKPLVGIMPAGSFVTMCGGNPANLVGTIDGTVTYQWSMGGSPIAGATNHNYVATMTGVYTLDISFSGCTWTLPSKTVLPDPNASVGYNTTGNYLFTGSFTTYQWYRNGAAISGATGSILPSPTPGSYYVVVSDITGCMDTSDVYNHLTTGLNTPGLSADIKVFPNPASSVLYINAPVKVSVSLVAPDGRIVMDAKEASSINVSGLPSGLYMVLIYDENNALLKTERFSKID